MMNKVKQNTADPNAALANSILKKPYCRFVVPESDGTWRGEIIEFEGCIATGQTRQDALQSLDDTYAFSWLCSAIAQGYPIPEPTGGKDYSGKLMLSDRKGAAQESSLCRRDRRGKLKSIYI